MDVDHQVGEVFPDLHLLTAFLSGVQVAPSSDALETFKTEIISIIKTRYTLETLKDVKELRLYRDFFWKIGTDPTKVRPASEALIRRVIQGNPLPTINTLVDSYNIASMESRVPLATFDRDQISSQLLLRFAVRGETFIGIGGKHVELQGNELVIQSGEDVIALYPHRDADKSKVTFSTHDVVCVVCGVPGISLHALEDARTLAEEYITRFCGGTVKRM